MLKNCKENKTEKENKCNKNRHMFVLEMYSGNGY